MGCQRYHTNFTLYLEGVMDRSQREAMEQHLRGCAACRFDLETLSQTVAWARSLPRVQAPAHAQAAVARKVRMVQQPMGWLEQLRLQWRTAGAGAQARAWAMGLAATVLLFAFGATSIDRWKAPAEPLSIGAGLHRGAQPEARPSPGPATAKRVQEGGYSAPAPSDSRVVPGVVGAPAGGTRVRAWVESQVAAGRPTTVYLYLEPERDLDDAEVFLYPASGITVGGGAVLQSDSSYLVYRGPVSRANFQTQWLPVDLHPSREGIHTMQVAVRENGQPVAGARISIDVVSPAR